MAGVLDDKQLLIQTCIYFLLIPMGVMVSVSVSLNTRDMNGHCLMYAHIHSLENRKIDFEPGVAADCHFTVAVNVIFSMTYALFVGIIHAVGIRANIAGQNLDSNPLDFVQGPIVNALFLAGNVLGAVFNFVAACIFSAGLSQFCDSLSEAALQEENPLHDCSEGETQIDWSISNAGDGSSYHTHMATALIGQWIVFVLFLTHIGLNGLTVLKQIKARRGDDAHDNATLMIINALRNRSQRANEVKGRSTEVRALSESNGESHNATMHRFYPDIKRL